MRKRAAVAAYLLGIVLLLGASFASGCSILGVRTEGGTTSGGVVEQTTSEYGLKADPGRDFGSAEAPQSVDAVAAPTRQVQDSLVISTAGITIEVKSLDSAVTAVRDLATKYGATIANLSVSAGESDVPRPLDASSEQYSSPTPGSATITLRVPVAKLADAQKDIALLGRVISQTSSQDDVTQQHVDMKARLKNLQAEESRLRTFFLKAKKVSEMLAIEQELARVRGEIESMQAQITYLERQAAMATLTVSLRQPGALVSPAAGGWGFSEAIRDGIRAAATVTRGLITMLLAFSPLIIIGLLLFFVIRAAVLRRRKHHSDQSQSEEATDASAAGAHEPPVQP